MTVSPSFGGIAPPEDPHVLALRILSEPRFRIRVPGRVHKTWWDSLWQWLADRWNTIIDAFSRNVHLGKNTGVAIGDVLIVCAILVVVVACVRLAMQAVREQNAVRGGELQAPRRSARELYEQAVHAAAQGLYGAAIALLFRSTLAALDIRHVIDDAPSHTVNECRGEIASRVPTLAAPFDSIARAFTAVAYADAPAGEAEWNAVRDVYNASFVRRIDET